MELISQKRSPGLIGEVRQFKEILLELSERLKNVNPYELDGEINRGLDLISRFFNYNFNDNYIVNKNITDTSWRNSFSITKPDTASLFTDKKFTSQLDNEQLLTKEILEEFHYFGEIMIEALERKRSAGWTKEFTRFEHFLGEISTAYNNFPSCDIENKVVTDMGRFAKLLAADRCIFYLFGEDKHNIQTARSFFWWREEDYISDEDQGKWATGYPDCPNAIKYLFERSIIGKSICCERLDTLPEGANNLKELYHELGIKSFISFPVSVSGVIVGAFVLLAIVEYRKWPEDLLFRLKPIAEVFANAIIRKQSEERFHKALLEIKKLRESIENNHVLIKDEIKFEDTIVGKSSNLKQVLIKVKQVANTNVTVLLLGETGTGKSLIAKAIHNASRNRNKEIIQVNCASFAPSLIESELFGHEKGSFTGAHTKRIGCFERARGTTLFLDEIGELPMELQAKLLRVIQEGEFERVGGSETLKTDARIIAATNKDLEKEAMEGRFRKDLWYRLNIFPIIVPPLRKRLEDIPQLLNLFVDKYSSWSGKRFIPISVDMIIELQKYSWPGNIRELENLIMRAVIISSGENLQLEIPHNQIKYQDSIQTLEESERSHIIEALSETAWRVEGPYGAAKLLGLKPSTLRMRMKKLDIKRPGTRNS